VVEGDVSIHERFLEGGRVAAAAASLDTTKQHYSTQQNSIAQHNKTTLFNTTKQHHSTQHNNTSIKGNGA